ncbi:MAG: hypothetical protein HYT43_00490 [Candidatus Taylorbacteria bacterium]|nr:hypothetical protein [Candidatus Taylorbacteria bacterium]
MIGKIVVVWLVSSLFGLMPARAVNITFPNGGEALLDGEPSEIRWTFPDWLASDSLVSIEVKGLIGDCVCWGYEVGRNIPISNQSYLWMPRVLRESGERYLIEIKVADSLLKDWSDAPFSIILPEGVTRSLSILSPAPGGAIYSNTWTTVRWSSSAIPLDSLVYLGSREFDRHSELGSDLYASNVNSGQYLWKVHLPPGLYDLDIWWKTEYGIFGAYSLTKNVAVMPEILRLSVFNPSGRALKPRHLYAFVINAPDPASTVTYIQMIEPETGNVTVIGNSRGHELVVKGRIPREAKPGWYLFRALSDEVLGEVAGPYEVGDKYRP